LRVSIIRGVVGEAHCNHRKDAVFVHSEIVETSRSVCLSKYRSGGLSTAVLVSFHEKDLTEPTMQLARLNKCLQPTILDPVPSHSFVSGTRYYRN